MSGESRLETLEKLERPLRSEAAMFRIVVAVGLAAAPVIAVGLIFGSLPATIVLLFEIGLAIGVAWRRRRATASRLPDDQAANATSPPTS
jgi:hypothetical protein